MIELDSNLGKDSSIDMILSDKIDIEAKIVKKSLLDVIREIL